MNYTQLVNSSSGLKQLDCTVQFWWRFQFVISNAVLDAVLLRRDQSSTSIRLELARFVSQCATTMPTSPSSLIAAPEVFLVLPGAAELVPSHVLQYNC